MSKESLEERVENSKTKFSMWDFLVAAYSSSKAVKIFLSAIFSGYSYLSSAAASVGFYLTSKTIGLATKYIAKFVINPVKNYNLADFMHKNWRSLNPIGYLKRPTLMGATLSAIAYVTGF